jgi:hypothetical protein
LWLKDLYNTPPRFSEIDNSTIHKRAPTKKEEFLEEHPQPTTTKKGVPFLIGTSWFLLLLLLLINQQKERKTSKKGIMVRGQNRK